MYVYIPVPSTKGPRDRDFNSAEHMEYPHLYFYLFIAPTKRNWGSLKKWLTLGLGQENECQINLEYLVMPESKELLKQ